MSPPYVPWCHRQNLTRHAVDLRVPEFTMSTNVWAKQHVLAFHCISPPGGWSVMCKFGAECTPQVSLRLTKDITQRVCLANIIMSHSPSVDLGTSNGAHSVDVDKYQFPRKMWDWFCHATRRLASQANPALISPCDMILKLSETRPTACRWTET